MSFTATHCREDADVNALTIAAARNKQILALQNPINYSPHPTNDGCGQRKTAGRRERRSEQVGQRSTAQKLWSQNHVLLTSKDRPRLPPDAGRSNKQTYACPIEKLPALSPTTTNREKSCSNHARTHKMVTTKKRGTNQPFHGKKTGGKKTKNDKHPFDYIFWARSSEYRHSDDTMNSFAQAT